MIELPLALCLVLGLILLVALSFVIPEAPLEDTEEFDPRRHPKPNDRYWFY